MVYCSKCGLHIGGGLKELKVHLKEERHVAPFVCREGDCFDKQLSYDVKSSWLRHLEQLHPESCDPVLDSFAESVQQVSSSHPHQTFNLERPSLPLECGFVTNESGDDDNHMDVEVDSVSNSSNDIQDVFSAELENAAASLVLRLKRRGNVPGVAVTLVVNEAAKLMEDVVAATLRNVSSNLQCHHVDQSIIESCVNSVVFKDPFVNLRNPEKQLDTFHGLFGLIKPKPKPLPSRWDERRDKKTGLQVQNQISVSFQYVPIIDILIKVLNNPILFNLIHSEKPSSDGHLRSYLDGTVAKSHPLISKYPHTIRINKWMDDSEVVNPCGSKTSIHKVVTDAFTIQNLPPSENSRLRSIFVSSYVYREDLPSEEGVDALFEPFFFEMEELESEEGVIIEVNNQPYTLRATLTSCSADALAGHEMVGLGSPSCNRFCSLCLINKHELHQNIMAMGVMRSEEVHKQNLEELRMRGQAFAIKSSGLKKESRLVSLPKYASFPEALIKDPMHDVLRGIAPMEIKLVLHEFCMVKKYFSVEDFNAYLKSFDYGPADLKNKPSPNFTHDSLSKPFSYVLHQSAAQTWCLLRAFPFLVDSKVPRDCLYLNLIVLLKRMSDIIFSCDVTLSDLDQLELLTYEHHNLFISLYPPQPSSNEASDPALPEEADDEDFLEEEEMMEEEVDDPQPSQTANDKSTKKKKRKREMNVRALLKHHYVLHYAWLIRNYGPLPLYWCMRYEGKNALIKRFGAICNNFKNLPVTFANLHQTVQTADFLDWKCSVKDEISFPRGRLQVACCIPGFEALSAFNVKEDDVLQEVTEATVGGFRFIVGLNVTLPLEINHLPLFAKISAIYIFKDKVLMVTSDFRTIDYSVRFGAYHIEELTTSDQVIRSFISSQLPPVRPMTAWTPDNVTFYLSPRNVIPDPTQYE